MSLKFKDIGYSVRSGKGKNAKYTQILKGMSGEIQRGEMVAIIGSSGAGKSTLLNILSGRISTGSVSGQITYRGKRRVPQEFKKVTSYVMQDDILFPTLTVYETLLYSAQLKIDSSKYDMANKRERVEEVIKRLRLTQARNTLIGDEAVRGVSGGERKRVSIGVEIITEPELIMLDEPTSGLDSNSAENVMRIIKNITREKNLITVSSIHQPNARTFSLFDKVILLTGGKIVYFGPTEKALDYFLSIGYECPAHENPADFFINMMTVDTNTEEAMEESRQRIEHLKKSWENNQKSSGDDTLLTEKVPSSQASDSGYEKSHPHGGILSSVRTEFSNGWFGEFAILLRRSWRKQSRDTGFLISAVMSAIIQMLLIGFTFFNQGTGFAKAQNKIGLSFLIVINLVFPVVMPMLGVMIKERNVMLRERASGSYRVSTFLLSTICTKLPVSIVQNAIFVIGIYFLAKFQYDVAKFFICFGIYMTTVICSFMIATAISTIAPTVEIASVLAPIFLSVFLIYGGNAVNLDTVTRVLFWLKYVSYIYYSYMGVMQNEFSGLTFECSNDGQSACLPTGEAVLDAYKLTEFSIYQCALLNIAISLVFLAVAYLLLRFKAKPKYIYV
ncbi:ABC transporter G family member 7 [Zancudomyces culisetae]|uniref:ABC transporter G family member 7 n=1 Tax=Zancudomyces culisetae TaxID=1213189 RepID=A0A1R1PQH8_ZANCU|nr:ABC transporter G family member 7 [Zancudomyces culisetae]|eukprot:OMH83246.1 ABC transporter G family member 7 [Zancudomyces culisetae]